MTTSSTAPTLDQIAQALLPLVPAGFRAVLFGSRAGGSASRGSDWDIGILGPSPLDGARMTELRDALAAIPTLHSFDLVDLATVSPSSSGGRPHAASPRTRGSRWGRHGEALRTAMKLGWIGDDPLWLHMLDDRNRTSHTYNEATAEEIYARLPAYAEAIAALAHRLKDNY